MQPVISSVVKGVSGRRVKYLIYVKHFLILSSTVTGFVSVTSLIVVPLGITSSAVRLKICAITSETKKRKSVLKKRR